MFEVIKVDEMFIVDYGEKYTNNGTGEYNLLLRKMKNSNMRRITTEDENEAYEILKGNPELIRLLKEDGSMSANAGENNKTDDGGVNV